MEMLLPTLLFAFGLFVGVFVFKFPAGILVVMMCVSGAKIIKLIAQDRLFSFSKGVNIRVDAQDIRRKSRFLLYWDYQLDILSNRGLEPANLYTFFFTPILILGLVLVWLGTRSSIQADYDLFNIGVSLTSAWLLIFGPWLAPGAIRLLYTEPQATDGIIWFTDDGSFVTCKICQAAYKLIEFKQDPQWRDGMSCLFCKSKIRFIETKSAV